MSDEAAPTAVVRRLAREYGWLLTAVGLGALVLACSVPFVTGRGMSWSSGDPLAAPVQVAPPAGSATGVVPEKSAAPPTSAAPAAPSPTPSKVGTQRRPAARTSSAAPPRTTPPVAAAPKPPVALGPEGGAMGLWQMLRDYCQRTYSTPEAQLRYGTGVAEDNWECRQRGQNPLIDMNAACRGRYGNAAFAQFASRTDAFSWHCFRR